MCGSLEDAVRLDKNAFAGDSDEGGGGARRRDPSDRLVAWCHGSTGFVPLLCVCARVFGEAGAGVGGGVEVGAGAGAGAGVGGGVGAGGGGDGKADDSAVDGTHRSYLDAACELGEVVWERGLLRKGVGLCHGICGNGYALLSLFRATGDPKYLHRARQFAIFAASQCDPTVGGGQREGPTGEGKEGLLWIPDRPFSLYEGVCGAIHFFCDVLDSGNDPHRSFMPGYEVPLPVS